MRGFCCFSPTRSGYGHGCMSDHPLMIFAPSSSKAVTDGFEGVRLFPSVNIHMAVGEADSRPAFVVRARGMPVIASSLNGDPEGGHANAFQGYESFKVSVEREQARAAEGETPLSELNRLKESLLSTEQGWISAIRNYQLSRDRFKMDLGLSMDTLMILDETELKDLEIHHPELSVDQAVEVALKMRLDLDNTRDRLIDSERRIRIAADGLQADLDLRLSGQLSSRPGEGFQFPDFRQRSWTAALGVDLPINRKAERNSYRSALIASDRARRQQELFLDQVKLDIQDGWRNLEQRKREFEISQVRVELSQNRRDEEILKRELGLGLALDLVDAQNDLINSQNQLTSALISHTIAGLGFWRDMGILFIKEGGQWEEKDYELLQ